MLVYVFHEYRCPWRPKGIIRSPGARVVSHSTHVLGTEPGSSERAATDPALVDPFTCHYANDAASIIHYNGN